MKPKVSEHGVKRRLSSWKSYDHECTLHLFNCHMYLWNMIELDCDSCSWYGHNCANSSIDQASFGVNVLPQHYNACKPAVLLQSLFQKLLSPLHSVSTHFGQCSNIHESRVCPWIVWSLTFLARYFQMACLTLHSPGSRLSLGCTLLCLKTPLLELVQVASRKLTGLGTVTILTCHTLKYWSLENLPKAKLPVLQLLTALPQKGFTFLFLKSPFHLHQRHQLLLL